MDDMALEPMGKTWRIHVKKRSCAIPGTSEHHRFVKLMVVDGVGLFASKDDTPEKVRGCLIGIYDDCYLIQAPTREEAIVAIAQFPGFSTGIRAKAMMLNMDRLKMDQEVVEDIPLCERMCWTDGKGLVCNDPSYAEDNYGMGCILDGVHPPRNCPIEQAREKKEAADWRCPSCGASKAVAETTT